jgi:PKHD-type hydroxylase
MSAQSQRVIHQVFMQQAAFSPDECGRIRALGEDLKRQGLLQPATADLTGSGEMTVSEYRQSLSQLIMPNADNRWIFQRLFDIIIPVNQAGYQFDLTGFEQGFQISEYPIGNGYDWHLDLGMGKSMRRKLSMTLQLSETSDYDGGELEFRDGELVADRKVGSLCVFPSFLRHRVRPLTRGNRWSLVSWICGEPFR